MEKLQWQVLSSVMYNALLSTATTIGTNVINKPVGQILLEYTDKCLWTVEKSVQWFVLPKENSGHKNEDVSTTATKELTTVISSEKPEDGDTIEQTENAHTLVRPLPWVLFLPVLVCLRVAKTSLDVCSYVLHKENLEPSSIVEFIQTKRSLLQEIKGNLKNGQEQKTEDKQLDDLIPQSSSNNDEPEKQENKEINIPTEKEIPKENTEMATSSEAASSSSEAIQPSSNIAPPSCSSPCKEENSDQDDSSTTLEASVEEQEDTKDDDFHSVKSSSTYFSPESSDSHHAVSEDFLASERSTTEVQNVTTDPPSLAAAIEELRSLTVPESEVKTPVPTLSSGDDSIKSLSSSTSSIKQGENVKKRSTFSNFFQVKRKMT